MPEIAADQIRALEHDNKVLEVAVDDARDENEGLVVMVAVQFLRLMLANWRRPLYRGTLRSRMLEVGDVSCSVFATGHSEDRIEKVYAPLIHMKKGPKLDCESGVSSIMDPASNGKVMCRSERSRLQMSQ